MGATYDARLVTEKDWVRHLVGDRNLARPVFQDEEIEAVLAETGGNRFRAAYRLGQILYQKEGSIVSKAVDDLHLTYNSNKGESYLKYLEWLKHQGTGRRLAFRVTNAHD